MGKAQPSSGTKFGTETREKLSTIRTHPPTVGIDTTRSPNSRYIDTTFFLHTDL